MTDSLKPHVNAIIHDKVASGRYGDANDVIEQALRLLDQHERMEHLRALLADGLASGEPIEWTSESMAEIEREVEEAYERGERSEPRVHL